MTRRSKILPLTCAIALLAVALAPMQVEATGLKESIKATAHEIGHGAKRAAKEVKYRAKKTGKAIGRAAKEVAYAIKSGAQEVKRTVKGER